jgi:AraC-like DNA-binding protein
MEHEKPYANPDFQLADLREVLPMNRTYLSHFIKSEYGCTFYQFVNRYRIAEAKRLKLAHPELKAEEVAGMCVFSSRNVFTNVFTREEGISPREWYKKQNPA